MLLVPSWSAAARRRRRLVLCMFSFAMIVVNSTLSSARLCRGIKVWIIGRDNFPRWGAGPGFGGSDWLSPRKWSINLLGCPGPLSHARARRRDAPAESHWKPLKENEMREDSARVNGPDALVREPPPPVTVQPVVRSLCPVVHGSVRAQEMDGTRDCAARGTSLRAVRYPLPPLNVLTGAQVPEPLRRDSVIQWVQ